MNMNYNNSLRMDRSWHIWCPFTTASTQFWWQKRPYGASSSISLWNQSPAYNQNEKKKNETNQQNILIIISIVFYLSSAVERSIFITIQICRSMNHDTSNCVMDFMANFGVCRHSFKFLFWADNDIIFITPVPPFIRKFSCKLVD